MLTVQTNASYAHKLGVKGGKWQLTNDGSTYTEIARAPRLWLATTSSTPSRRPK